MDLLSTSILQFMLEVVIFGILTLAGIFIANKVKNSSNRYLNLMEFLPEDEILTLKQVFYLIMMAACFVNVFYSLVFVNDDFIFLAIFDIVLSLYVAVTLDKNSLKNKILTFLLIPFGALSYLMSFSSPIIFLDFIHVPVFIYFIKLYYDKFHEFTDSNGLGITIFLLFAIVFISFFVTIFTEGVNSLDSLVMVSNAFTSNGFTILGESVAGKINSIILVWGGYIISGAGTATLTAAILMRHFNKRFRELERLIDEGDDEQ